MQRLSCELCGSNDIVKQEGLYVCQHCGSKYSPAEAKKMLVQGTVQINYLPSTDNLLELADNAFKARKYEEAEEYSNRAIEINAFESRAWYQKAVAIGAQVEYSPSRIREYVVCFNKSISLITDEKEKSEVIEEFIENMGIIVPSTLDRTLRRFEDNVTHGLANDVAVLVEDLNELYASTYEQYGKDPGDFNQKLTKKVVDSVARAYDGTTIKDYTGNKEFPRKSDLDLYLNRVGYLTQILDIVFPVCDDKELKLSNLRVKLFILSAELNAASYRKKRGGEIEKEYSLNDESKKRTLEEIAEVHKQIKQLDPTYKIPKNTGGCYIATVVYGSYDCPQVWVLRRFRDQFLLKSRVGNVFVKIYYCVSPVLVRFFGNSKWFKQVCLIPIDFLVRRLISNGFSDTPYDDTET